MNDEPQTYTHEEEVWEEWDQTRQSRGLFSSVLVLKYTKDVNEFVPLRKKMSQR